MSTFFYFTDAAGQNLLTMSGMWISVADFERVDGLEGRSSFAAAMIFAQNSSRAILPINKDAVRRLAASYGSASRDEAFERLARECEGWRTRAKSLERGARDLLAQLDESQRCRECDGDGFVVGDESGRECAACRGTGKNA